MQLLLVTNCRLSAFSVATDVPFCKVPIKHPCDADFIHINIHSITSDCLKCSFENTTSDFSTSQEDSRKAVRLDLADVMDFFFLELNPLFGEVTPIWSRLEKLQGPI